MKRQTRPNTDAGRRRSPSSSSAESTDFPWNCQSLQTLDRSYVVARCQLWYTEDTTNILLRRKLIGCDHSLERQQQYDPPLPTEQ
eukprot:scaffold95060_cov17-Prasinocladus_malaysianus.AAC.1